MGFQVKLSTEGDFTVSKSAGMLLEIPVHTLHVPSEIIAVCKRFHANITLMVSFLCMNIPVFLQVIISSKRFTTNITREWTFTGMDKDVALQLNNLKKTKNDLIVDKVLVKKDCKIFFK